MAYVNLGQVMYPIGSIYQSWDSTSPATLFGGQWTQIIEKFLYCSNSSGGTGGATSVTLTTNQIPAHRHSGTANSAGGHTHLVGGDDDCQYAKNGNTSLHRAGHPGNNRNVGTSKAGAHTHSLSINNTGGGAAHENMPPYVRCYAWRRHA